MSISAKGVQRVPHGSKGALCQIGLEAESGRRVTTPRQRVSWSQALAYLTEEIQLLVSWNLGGE